MYYRNRHIFYIHIPKSGGSSITQMLVKFAKEHHVPFYDSRVDKIPNLGLDRKLLKASYTKKGQILFHLTAYELRKILKPEVLQNSFWFTLIRNPYNRLISTWKFSTVKHAYPRRLGWPQKEYPKVRDSFKTWLHYRPRHTNPCMISKTMRKKLLDLGKPCYNDRFTAQHYWVHHPTSGKCLVDRVYRLEDFDSAMTDLNKSCKVDLGDPIHVNITKHKPYQEYYQNQPELIKHVKKYFSLDLKYYPEGLES